jgi:hypothetical protein
MKFFTSIVLLGLLPVIALAQDSTWSCTVPSGFTYDQVKSVTKICGAGSQPYYHLRTPEDGLLACLQITGFVYDRVTTSTLCSPTGAPTIQYHLRKPVDGLMSCGPGTYNGFVFDYTIPTTQCTLSGPGQLYHLRAPTDGLWSCAQLIGFIYDNVTTSTDCAINGASNYLYRLRKPVDGLWACGPGTYNNYTYDEAVLPVPSDCDLGTGPGTKFHLRKPEVGLWACSIPPGFHYSQVKTSPPGTCVVGGQGLFYLLS